MYSISLEDFLSIAKNLEYVLMSCSVMNCESGDIMNVLPKTVIEFIEDSDDFEYETNYWLHSKFFRENIWIGSKYFVSFLFRHRIY